MELHLIAVASALGLLLKMRICFAMLAHNGDGHRDMPLWWKANSTSLRDHRRNSERTTIAEYPNKLICFYLFTEDFDPVIMSDLCTHINVGFFGINSTTYSVDKPTVKLQALQQIAKLKKKKKALKILVSIGGAGCKGFSSMVKKHKNRKMFIKSVVDLLKKFNLDGVDLDWEWPAMSGKPREKIKFLQLLSEFKTEFARHRHNYLLSIDVSSSKQISELAYMVKYTAESVDFINIMCYDYHYFTKWYPFTDHNSPLYSSSLKQSFLLSLNINSSVHYWLSNSMPRQKIVLGVPTYGHTYRLSAPEMVNVHSPASGWGSIGRNGFASYPEICQFIKQKNATIIFDDISKVPYAYKFPNWISYDDELSLTYKGFYVRDNGLSGIMIFSVNADDYSGICSSDGVQLPLIRKLRSILFNEV